MGVCADLELLLLFALAVPAPPAAPIAASATPSPPASSSGVFPGLILWLCKLVCRCCSYRDL